MSFSYPPFLTHFVLLGHLALALILILTLALILTLTLALILTLTLPLITAPPYVPWLRQNT